MRSLWKLLPAAIAVVAATIAAMLAGTSNGGNPQELPGLPGFSSYQPIPGCIEEVDPRVRDPEFRPDSLTLPRGSFAIRTPEDPAPGLHIIVYAVPAGLDDFVQHVLDRWPSNGWELGRGERELGEAESVFFLPDKSRYGQFRARSVYCDLDVTEVTLTLGEDVRGSPS